MSGSTIGSTIKASGSIGATLTLISVTTAKLNGYYIGNTANSATSYLQVFDANSIASVTLGTTAPLLSIPIPPNGAANLSLDDGIRFWNGIVIAFTTTRTGSTGPVSTCDYNFWFSA